MKSNKHVSSTVLTLLFSTAILGTYSFSTEVKADQVEKTADTTSIKSTNVQTSQEQEPEQVDKTAGVDEQDTSVEEETTEAADTETADNEITEETQNGIDDKDNVESSKTNDVEQTENSESSQAEVSAPEKTDDKETSQVDSAVEEAKDVDDVITNDTENDESVTDEQSKTDTSETENVSANKQTKSQTKKLVDSQAITNGANLEYNENGEIVISDAKGNHFKNQFVNYDGATYYVDDNGVAAQDKWITQDGKQYYFDYSSQMLKQGVESTGDNHYLFAQDGSLVQKLGWYYYTQSNDEYENGWLYFNKDNSVAVDWQKINGHTFYFDYNGVMAEDQFHTFIDENENEKTYLFDKNGYLVEAGWNKVDDSWYLMNEDSSIVNDGWWQSGNGTYYYFDYGMATGVYEIGNSNNDGYTNYYFDQNGHLYQKQGWFNDGFDWFYVNSDSSLKEGWNNIGGEKYYFENGFMISNDVHMIEDTQGEYKAYLFDMNGHNFSKTGFAQLNGAWYLVLNDGSLAEGWQKINQDYYYFDGSIMLENQVTSIPASENQDEYYLFDKNGRLVTTPGWYYDDNTYYPYSVYHYVQNDQGKLATTGRYHIWKNDFYFDGPDLIVSQVIWDEGRPYYVNASGYFVTKQGKYQVANGLSTYVKSNGQVAVNEWINLAGHWYYADQEGYFSSDSSTITKNGKVYVFDNNGQYYNTTGWVVLHAKHDPYAADNYYYLIDGIAFANQWFQVNGQWYYADESGQVARNQAMYDNHGDLYHFNHDGSYMSTSGWYYDGFDGNWYLIGTDGQAVTNWFKLNNDWFYFHEDGSMETGNYFDGQKEYYFDESGHWKNNGWVKQYDAWTYLNDGATLSDGWQKVADKWYYFQDGDILVSRLIEDNGTIYIFDQYGNYSLGQKGWYYSAYEPAWYYLNDSHSYVTGWKKINNTWYYFDLGGSMLANTDTYIDGQHYLFDNNGAMVTKGQIYNHYLSVSGGVGRNVWVNVSGTWYYYDNDGFMLSDGVYNISGVDYYFDQDGKNVEKQGWVKVHDNGQYSNDYLRKPDYYYMENNKLVKNQWRMINKNWYYFDQDGLMAQGTRLVNGKYEQFSNNGSWIKG